MKRALLLSLLLLGCATPSLAVPDDIIINALSDEMDRSMKDLHVKSEASPYFMSYCVKEVDEAIYSSSLGSEPVVQKSRERILTPNIRIGNYELDSSYPHTSRPDTAGSMVVDDDYAEIRRSTWMDTDYAYKGAVTNYEWKKAYLSSNVFPDRLADLTEEKSVVSLGSTKRLTADDKRWKDTVKDLSAIFKKFPLLERSKITFVARQVNRWFVNSEGTKVRDSRSLYALKVWATAQSPDGAPLQDYDAVAATSESGIPDMQQLSERIETFAKRLTALRTAPKAEEYCGPVLFEDQAAAEFLAQVMAPNFGFAEDYLGTESWRNPIKNSIGRRVISKLLSVEDDPGAKDANGVPLVGYYEFDEDGMPAQKLNLVENGILKSFCQSRLPTHFSNHSNGHSLGGHGTFSIIKVSSNKTLTPEEMKSQLTEMAKDAGLDYIIVISRMHDDYSMKEYPSAEYRTFRPFMTPSYSQELPDPVVAYKLYLADGRRELIRGLEFRNVSLRAIRDIQAVANDSKSYIVEPNDYYARTFITPSFVVGELEFNPEKPEHSTPPKLPSPVALYDKTTTQQ